MQVCQVSVSSSLRFLRRRILNLFFFFRKFTLYVTRQPIKLSDLDKSHMKHGGLLNKHICEKKSNISSETAETVNCHFSHYKANILSMYAKFQLQPPYGFSEEDF